MNPDSGAQERALVENPIIVSSLLTRDIQEPLIAEIEEQVLAALKTPLPDNRGRLQKLLPKKPEPPKLYFVRGRAHYEGSVNYPFYISRSNKVNTGIASSEGPFNPQTTCAMAYLFTEGLILSSHSSHNDQLRQSLSLSEGTWAFGAGVTALAEFISNAAGSKKAISLTAAEILHEGITRVKTTYTDGIASWTNRYVEQLTDAGPDGPGVNYDASQLRLYQDGLKGIEHGVKLLAELSAYGWKIA